MVLIIMIGKIQNGYGEVNVSSERNIANIPLNPSNWDDPDHVHAVFAALRANEPISRTNDPKYPAFWNITKHADIFEIEKRNDAFLNGPRVAVSTLERETAIRALTGGKLNPFHSLVSMDPPEHQKLRVLTQGWFMPKNLEKLRGRIEDSANKQLDVLAEAGGLVEFSHDVALEFPLRVIMSVLGVPREDYHFMLKITQEIFGPDDPDTQRVEHRSGEEAANATMATFAEVANYFGALSDHRRAKPRDDVASIIANGEYEGKPLTVEQQLGYYAIIATAGHDTTSYSLSEAVRQLALNPELYDRLKAEPGEMATKIAEEAIRYASSVRHFVRTAKEDFTLRGQTIKKGDSVILWYPSGSRDEDVFEDPNNFDPDRCTKERHASFGNGPHICLGMHLARLEITTFLALLARRVDRIALNGEPKFLKANFVGGLKKLPIKAEFAN